MQRLDIEALYLDRTTCTRCGDSIANLDAALARLSSELDARGVLVTLRHIHVVTAKQARAVALQSAPTIRINGRDIAGPLIESPCEPCGDICDGSVHCREWMFDGKRHTAAPVEMLVASLSEAIQQPETSAPVQALEALPENLERFFSAKEDKTACCQPSCCS